MPGGLAAHLAPHAARLRGASVGALIDADPERAKRFTATLDDLTLDLGREVLDAPALDALLGAAEAAGLEAARDAMASGAPVNATEGRAALHMALRGSVAAPPGAEVAETRAAMLAFAEEVRTGRASGAGGAIADVVSLGIGGSDLGPAMAVAALAPDHDGPRVHFVSNVDPAHLGDTLAGLDPARTLFVVCSKTFTTQETMVNARAAARWLEAAGIAPGSQMAACSMAAARCAEAGIPPARIFGFWDWVGGRYSLWSAIGLPLAIAVGPARFEALLAGAAAMDRHFLAAPPARNLPVLLGLAGVWRRVAMGWPTVALVPYDQRLARFPAFVQQLWMESNGKRVRADGRPVEVPTAPVVWGEPGTGAQHSFFQLLHQGTDVVPVEFVLAAEPRGASGEAHGLLVANCLAQAEALARGRDAAEAAEAMRAEGLAEAEIARLAPHRTFPGGRPSTLILHRRLDAFSLGRLIALYEHRVFVEGVLLGINSFDQWGVELGKALVRGIAAAGPDHAGLAPETAASLARIAALSGR